MTPVVRSVCLVGLSALMVWHNVAQPIAEELRNLTCCVPKYMTTKGECCPRQTTSKGYKAETCDEVVGRSKEAAHVNFVALLEGVRWTLVVALLCFAVYPFHTAKWDITGFFLVGVWFALFVPSSVFLWHGLVVNCSPATKPPTVLMNYDPFEFSLVLFFSCSIYAVIAIVLAWYILAGLCCLVCWVYCEWTEDPSLPRHRVTTV